MTWEAVVRFTPAYDMRSLVDDGGQGERPELIVSRDALAKLKSSEPTPVVVDHDDDRVVGRVREMWVGEDVDYGTRVRSWHFATCELDERPDWLERGSGVSWSYYPLREYTAWGTETTVLTRCIVREISILTPATAPAEPLARVALLRQVEPKPAERESVILGGAMIHRPAIGQVLGVR